MNDLSRPTAPETRQAVNILRDLPFGEGRIGHGTPEARTRTLVLDVYAPADLDPSGPRRPALILSHGGAYHRGAKDNDHFAQDGSPNTPVHEYCERFAARGYVCFSVGYRLTQELAAPQVHPIKRQRDRVSRGRIDYVRELLGLPVASDEELLHGVEGAFEDVAKAFRFVEAHAARWAIDTSRIGIGGFSAGAFASSYATYALGVPAAAVICLSGGMDAVDADYYVHGTRGQPPVLVFASEFDLPGVAERGDALIERAAAAGLGVRRYFVPGKPHFYDRDSAVVLQRSTLAGGEGCTTVESAIESFLDATLREPRVDVTVLEAFAQAWSRHDLDALMSFMSDDCVFHGWRGDDSSGVRHVGRAAVRAAFAQAWADFPDAQWTRARHFVSGNRGVSEWTFTGTRASDGVRVEVDGCDLFTFSGDRIRVKDSWRKLRV